MFFSSSAIKQLLEKYNLKPSKRLGQNFLIDQNILNKIIETADIQKDDVILEVGPGLGVLTFALSEKAKKVIAIEKDIKMCEILNNLIAEKQIKNIEVINDDILKFNICHSRESGNPGQNNLDARLRGHDNKYKLIANIPYYLTSPLIRKFLEAEQPPQVMILMIQKEVAKRICSAPPNMSLLAVSVQYYAEPKIISYISKNSFWPIPKVDSAIIKISPFVLPRPACGERVGVRGDNTKFFHLVKAGFSSPRKQLATNLSQKLKISREIVESAIKNCGLDPKQRAETLSVNDWQRLTNEFLKF